MTDQPARWRFPHWLTMALLIVAIQLWHNAKTTRAAAIHLRNTNEIRALVWWAAERGER